MNFSGNPSSIDLKVLLKISPKSASKDSFRRIPETSFRNFYRKSFKNVSVDLSEDYSNKLLHKSFKLLNKLFQKIILNFSNDSIFRNKFFQGFLWKCPKDFSFLGRYLGSFLEMCPKHIEGLFRGFLQEFFRGFFEWFFRNFRKIPQFSPKINFSVGSSRNLFEKFIRQFIEDFFFQNFSLRS